MVRDLHAAGLAVILDVVYNHTGEGDHEGPTLSFRGLDDGASYRSDPADRRRFDDVTGTGNTLDMRQPAMRELVLASLRYWLTEMHVDGFRFDLAVALARTDAGFDPAAPFLQQVAEDPILSDAILIAEPWDIGPGGYRLGAFHAPWAEWNGRYQDTVRDLWRGAPGALADFGRRFTGSADLFEASDRGPFASVNYVTTHDGFTLADLVSYDHKHNGANGEGGADGEADDRSWSCGVEGPTEDTEVLALRARQRRNLLATLLLSQGTPMLLAGDEIGRSQGGNNNAYCQDNEVSWTDWAGADVVMEAYVRRLLALRQASPSLRQPEWIGSDDGGDGTGTIGWFAPEGRRMRDHDWYAEPTALGIVLGRDPTFYIALNPAPEARWFTLPSERNAEHASWSVVFDTAFEDAFEPPAGGAPITDTAVRVEGRSLVLLGTAV